MIKGRDKTTQEWILVLTEHRVFGPRFGLYLAERLGEGRFKIIEASKEISAGEQEEMNKLNELFGLVQESSDQRLMKNWSRKKSILEFQREVNQETLERFIFPAIQSANHRIVDAAIRYQIPVFFRQEQNITLFYEDERIHLLDSPAQCVFHFIRNEEGLQYYITLLYKEKKIELQTPKGVVLSNKPAVVLFNKQILQAENIEAQKLLPFFTKRSIRVPASSEEAYLKGFVCKMMKEYQVVTEGLPVRKITPQRKAVLSLEKDLEEELALLLTFHYGEHYFYPGNPDKKEVQTENVEGEIGIRWYERDLEWESGLISRLREAGLKTKGSNHFHIGKEKGENPYRLLEWLNRQEPQFLALFEWEQQLEKNYFTGMVALHPTLHIRTDWFELQAIVEIGTFRIPFYRFRKHILSGKKEYILPDNSVFIIPDEWFAKYYHLLNYAREAEGGLRINKYHASLVENSFPGKVPQSLLQDFKTIPEGKSQFPPLPQPSTATLRPYQERGFFWMNHLYQHHFGGCLADDMGLGKTLQTITLLRHIYGQADSRDVVPVASDGQLSLFNWEQPALPASLVVVPTSLLHNWRNELQRFAPELNLHIYVGSKKERTGDREQIFNQVQVVITSYGILRNDINYFRKQHFQLIILDESQHIKNTESQSYQAVMQLKSQGRFVLTGTPIENSLEDLWAQFNFINEGLLGNLSLFRKDFIIPIVKEENKEREALLKRMTAPFILRRTKEEVTPELPPLQQEVVYCDMTEEQQQIYESEKNSIRNLLFEQREHPELPLNRFIALEGLSKLRQLACHPQLQLPDYNGDSGKFEQILLSFESLLSSNHKVLIFSSYVRHLNLLASRFETNGWKYAMLTGRTLHREEEIERFLQNDDIHCFFISLKAGSTGLNLVAADYVFIIDPWWNPAAEMQALSRAHRIGQDKPVFVYRFISTNTIEEKIIRLQQNKAQLSQTFVYAHDPLSTMDEREFNELFD